MSITCSLSNIIPILEIRRRKILCQVLPDAEICADEYAQQSARGFNIIDTTINTNCLTQQLTQIDSHHMYKFVMSVIGRPSLRCVQIYI